MTNAMWKRLGLWAIWFFVVIIGSVFLHEVGHGVGATIDGIHISTGFNKVGMPDKTPDDPDFRTGMPDGIWSGLLGPIVSWALAIVFTIALYQMRRPTPAAFLVGATAVANGLLRAAPMTMFLIPALGGQLHVEDEVAWGIWMVTHVFRPDLSGVTLSEIPPGLLLSYPAVWILPLFSLAISLACLIFAYRGIFKLEGARMSHWSVRLLFVALPVAAWLAAQPVLGALDRVVRINW